MDINLKDENQINVEPGELLEDCWFFGNTKSKSKSKSRMLRSFSDPCSSSNFAGSCSYEETYESINKLSRDRTTATKERRSNRKASTRNSLVRAPSLPTSLETDDFDEEEEEEMEFSMGKLIRQASLNYSHARPPRTKSSSLRRRKAESVKPEVNKLTTQKSLKDVGIEELQGFKDLGIFDLEERERRSPNVGNIEKRRSAEESEERRGARPYVAEAPPVSRWGGKRSTEDMKAQIKFWARTVASNVRQEC